VGLRVTATRHIICNVPDMGLEYITWDKIQIIKIMYFVTAKSTSSGVNDITFRKLSVSFAGDSRFCSP
jgi:hypothetical protein